MAKLNLKDQQNQNRSQQNFYGTFMQDNETSPMAMSDPNEMRFLGAGMGEYGGSIPMAAYGASMGGSYYPTMSRGGMSRVRIKSLPGFDGGGANDKKPPKTSWEEGQTYQGGSKEWDDWYTSESAKEYRTNRYNAYKARRQDVGKDVVTEDVYHDIYRRGQRQIGGLQDFYQEADLNSGDWDDKTGSKGGRNWKYKKAIKAMNDKIAADNPDATPEELAKLQYKALSRDDIGQFQSGYIGGVFMDAAGGKTGDDLVDFVHSGKNDQTVDVNGTIVNISPEDRAFGNTTNRQRDLLTIPITANPEEKEEIVEKEEEEVVDNNTQVKEETVTVEEEDKQTGKKMCRCYPLNAQGKPDTSKAPISETPAVEGKPCPKCKATIVGKQKQKQQLINDPKEISQRSDQFGRNAMAASLMRTDQARMNPALVTPQEISGVTGLTNTSGITNALSTGSRSIDTGGGSTASKHAQRVNLLGKGMDTASQLYGQNKKDNRSVIQEMKNQNAYLANLNLVDRAGQKEQNTKDMWNYYNQRNQIGYRDGAPWFRRVYQNPNLDPNALANNDKKTKKTKKGSNSQYGGSVNSNTFIPRYNTMPYGN